MADDDDDSGQTGADLNEELFHAKAELKQFKAKYRQLELKSKEFQLNSQKNLTELQALRNQVKVWKEAAVTVYTNVWDFKKKIEKQYKDLEGIVNIFADERNENFLKDTNIINNVKNIIQSYQATIKKQEEDILMKKQKIDE